MSSEMYLSLRERFDRLLRVMASSRFLRMEGLGNEVPFFICPYDPKEAEDAGEVVGLLRTQLSQRGISVLSIDLYDLAIQLLTRRGIFPKVLEVESDITKGELKELLQNVLDPEAHLIPAIAEKMQEDEFQILFITGVGEVYPYIRSHNVLNNLQHAAKGHPTVMFFPGKYTHSPEGGTSLKLFGQLQDDRYYRAFNIDHYQL